ncbi:MAG TPA: gluconate 2-dehydrogenase subunit 3 family protein [Gammaproteobacteria bacterium]|jgi:hypothetical protein|nr:gluconate 2-dehydrogenase subunit 3 family protein [Gammaproteobacteria bacterium]
MADTPIPADLLTRREALRRVSLLLGGTALIGESVWVSGAAQGATSKPLFSANEIALLGEIADTILPATSTPGAKAAGVGPFIAVMVTDVYDAGQQKIFRAGLKTLERECRKQNGADFMSATPAQRTALLERLDREQYEAAQRGGPPHYFRMLKELTLLGYFTSEIGYTQAMRYTETPGRFDPCVPYTPGEKAWAPHA